jgi:hypothetical protein
MTSPSKKFTKIKVYNIFRFHVICLFIFYLRILSLRSHDSLHILATVLMDGIWGL